MRRFLCFIAVTVLCAAPILAQETQPAPTPAPEASRELDQLKSTLGTLAQVAQAPGRPTTPPRPVQPAPPQPPGGSGIGGPPPAPQAPPAAAAPPAPPSPRVESAPTQSVRIEVTITDSLSAGAPTKKTVTMLVADNRNGRIRTTNFVRFSDVAGSTPSQTTPVTLNVDARPTLRTDARILVDLTIEYMPEAPANSGGLRPSSITESLSALVPDGKSTLISQSADPVTDRKVTIEVTATVVK